MGLGSGGWGVGWGIGVTVGVGVGEAGTGVEDGVENWNATISGLVFENSISATYTPNAVHTPIRIEKRNQKNFILTKCEKLLTTSKNHLSQIPLFKESLVDCLFIFDFGILTIWISVYCFLSYHNIDSKENVNRQKTHPLELPQMVFFEYK